eukprot:621845-Rhodomonas_salina.1
MSWNEGAVHEYLGCEVVRDWERGLLSLLQRGYTERVLKIYGFENATPVRTPLSPGIRLTKQDCPAVLDPALHRRYRSIVGHLSFLVQCTRPDLSFAYAELFLALDFGAQHAWPLSACDLCKSAVKSSPMALRSCLPRSDARDFKDSRCLEPFAP